MVLPGLGVGAGLVGTVVPVVVEPGVVVVVFVGAGVPEGEGGADVVLVLVMACCVSVSILVWAALFSVSHPSIIPSYILSDGYLSCLK